MKENDRLPLHRLVEIIKEMELCIAIIQCKRCGQMIQYYTTREYEKDLAVRIKEDKKRNSKDRCFHRIDTPGEVALRQNNRIHWN